MEEVKIKDRIKRIRIIIKNNLIKKDENFVINLLFIDMYFMIKYKFDLIYEIRDKMNLNN